MGGLFQLFGGRSRDFQESGHRPLFALNDWPCSRDGACGYVTYQANVLQWVYNETQVLSKVSSSAILDLVDANQFLSYPQGLCPSFKSCTLPLFLLCHLTYCVPFHAGPHMCPFQLTSLSQLTPRKVMTCYIWSILKLKKKKKNCHLRQVSLRKSCHEVPWWPSRLMKQRSHCCGTGLIPGPGTSACSGCSQKTNKQIQKTKNSNNDKNLQQTERLVLRSIYNPYIYDLNFPSFKSAKWIIAFWKTNLVQMLGLMPQYLMTGLGRWCKKCQQLTKLPINKYFDGKLFWFHILSKTKHISTDRTSEN